MHPNQTKHDKAHRENDKPLAELFLDCTRVEKRLLPGLQLTEQQKAADLDLYRRLLRIDELKREE